MKKKVFFVDDNENLLEMLKLSLDATGRYEVRTEANGLKALERIKAFGPDIIFLDITMPAIEGPEIAGMLKNEPSLSKVPIVFMTATVTADEVDRAGQKIGGQIFLAKPATVKQLIECIEANTK